MEMAEIVGIEEEELLGFIRSFPYLWEKDRGSYAPDLKPLIQRLGDTDEILFGVYLYTTGQRQITIFMEYQIFALNGYIINLVPPMLILYYQDSSC